MEHSSLEGDQLVPFPDYYTSIDIKAFSEKYALSIVNSLRSKGVPNDVANDILWEALTDLYIISQSEHIEKPENLLWRIVSNKKNDFFREKAKMKTQSKGFDENISERPEFDFDTLVTDSEIEKGKETDFHSLFVTLLENMAFKLNAEEQYILKAHFLEGESYEDIGITMNLKSNTVAQKCKRAKIKVKKYYLSQYDNIPSW